ncbi:TniQ family protein [Streptomyces sp. NBC_00631]|uniref:TniQ family protein n=1 Tax=Streptomyces sp. NBC_00631 TaxID=2975793 RepID=UPI0030E43412
MSPLRRTLPIRYAPHPGEALDSWLEFLAARLNCPFADVLRALRLPTRDAALAKPMLPRWVVLATGEELAAIAAGGAGVAEDVLLAMTLRRFDGHGVVIEPHLRRVEPRTLWGRARSRFCPACLADSGGRWQVTWRLGWSFRLHAASGAAGRPLPGMPPDPAPSRSPPPGDTPPRAVREPRAQRTARFSLPSPARRRPVLGIRPEGAVAQAQRIVDALLTPPDRPVRRLLYGPGGAPLRVVLSDARALGGPVLKNAAPSVEATAVR